MSSLEEIFLERDLMCETAVSVAFWIPFFIRIGLAPAVTFFRPSLIIAWARTVAVVVPSPAMSLVLDATSLTSCAPRLSNLSSRSISFAIDTPSLVIVGEPQLFSRTTFLPFGPSVILTASATASTPLSSDLRASSLYFRILAILIPPSILDLCQDIILIDDYVVVFIDLDLRA